MEPSSPYADGRPIPGVPPVVQGMTIALPRGARCLLIGSNGAGKTTLLKILGGKHMVPKSAVTVLGQPPFHDTDLTASGRLSYLGGNWDRDIAFAGYSIPLQADHQHLFIGTNISFLFAWPSCALIYKLTPA